VEAGRWQQRGGESQAVFGTSLAQAVGKDLKLAAKAAPARTDMMSRMQGGRLATPAYGGYPGIQGGQPGVWKEVDALQKKAEEEPQ